MPQDKGLLPKILNKQKLPTYTQINYQKLPRYPPLKFTSNTCPHGISTNSLVFQSTSLQFKNEDVMQKHIKSLARVHIHDISYTFGFISNITPSQKTNQMVRYYLSYVKPCWLSQISSFHMCLNISSRRMCSIISPGTVVGLSSL